MRQKHLLSVSILYEIPLDPELCKKLLAFFKPYELVIRLEIDKAHNIQKIT